MAGLTACSHHPGVPPEGPAPSPAAAAPARLDLPADLRAALQPAGDGVWISGEPGADTLARLATAGITHVIDLRHDETGDLPRGDEARAARRLGLHYVNIPVAGAAGLTRANVTALDDALRAAAGAPVLVHCATGNRAAALLALRAGWLHGHAAEQSVALMRASGLDRLEAEVLQRLAPRAD